MPVRRKNAMRLAQQSQRIFRVQDIEQHRIIHGDRVQTGPSSTKVTRDQPTRFERSPVPRGVDSLRSWPDRYRSREVCLGYALPPVSRRSHSPSRNPRHPAYRRSAPSRQNGFGVEERLPHPGVGHAAFPALLHVVLLARATRAIKSMNARLPSASPFSEIVFDQPHLVGYTRETNDGLAFGLRKRVKRRRRHLDRQQVSPARTHRLRLPERRIGPCPSRTISAEAVSTLCAMANACP